MKGNVTKFRFEQSEGNAAYRLYVYDDVTACGDWDWETLSYEDSETSAEYFRQQLALIPETAVIELHVNSYGGEVKEGTAIYNMLKQHKAEKVCYVDGFAYSIASVICMACDRIVMGLGTSMLIHNMSMRVQGNAKMLRKCADDLDVLMASNRQIYLARAKNLTEEELTQMMDRETYLTPEQCLEYGFCDRIGDYEADQKRIGQQAAAMVCELRQQLGQMQSFREEMRLFVGQAASAAGNTASAAGSQAAAGTAAGNAASAAGSQAAGNTASAAGSAAGNAASAAGSQAAGNVAGAAGRQAAAGTAAGGALPVQRKGSAKALAMMGIFLDVIS